MCDDFHDFSPAWGVQRSKQPNATGGRAVGGLANMRACDLELETLITTRPSGGAPSLPSRPALKAVDIRRAVADWQIKAIRIIRTNLFSQSPMPMPLLIDIAACVAPRVRTQMLASAG